MAGGRGTRLGADQPKAFVAVAGTALVEYAVRRAAGAPEVTDVVLVAPASHLAEAGAVASRALGRAVVHVVAGGAERTDSVAAGLRALPPHVEVVLVHDAARAFAPTALYSRLVAQVRAGHPAVVPGLPVTDTVKLVDGAGLVLGTPDRASLRAIQTPQAFRRDVLEAAHAGGSSATDDAALVEAAGGAVLVVEGDPLAFKVTTAADLEVAERLVAG